ncbi:hypothetical protein D3C75_1102410 [compost metagenome]
MLKLHLDPSVNTSALIHRIHDQVNRDNSPNLHQDAALDTVLLLMHFHYDAPHANEESLDLVTIAMH